MALEKSDRIGLSLLVLSVMYMTADVSGMVQPGAFRGVAKSYSAPSAASIACNWERELTRGGDAKSCAESSGCHTCVDGQWHDLGYESVTACSKASMACLNQRCSHLCR